MSEQTCGNCRWWVRLKHAPDAGECRRHAPAASARHADARWTTTWETDFCGEWADGTVTPEQELKDYIAAVRTMVPNAGPGLIALYKSRGLTVDEAAGDYWRLFGIPDRSEKQ